MFHLFVLIFSVCLDFSPQFYQYFFNSELYTEKENTSITVIVFSVFSGSLTVHMSYSSTQLYNNTSTPVLIWFLYTSNCQLLHIKFKWFLNVGCRITYQLHCHRITGASSSKKFIIECPYTWCFLSLYHANHIATFQTQLWNILTLSLQMAKDSSHVTSVDQDQPAHLCMVCIVRYLIYTDFDFFP
jgi:hypothetical protein